MHHKGESSNTVQPVPNTMSKHPFSMSSRNGEEPEKREKKNFIYFYIYILIDICYTGCKGIYIEKFFQSFLAKKSYDSWITRRRMEIYTKISKRKYLAWSRRNRGKFTPRMGCANFEGVVRISHKPGAVGFRRPYLPPFSSKLYTV